jgi:hypothetical protein
MTCKVTGKNVPESGRNRIRLLGDRNEELVVREYRQLEMLAIALDTLPAVFEPVRDSEIDRLVEVELYQSKTRWKRATNT